jgi:hypothetical protein
MVVQTKLTMKNSNEIAKAVNHLNSETTYTNRSGRNRGRWSLFSQFCHSKCISHLGEGIELEKPQGFGTLASNSHYPSFHYDEECVAAWEKALNLYQETNDLESAVEILNPGKNTYREGFSENVFFSAVIMALSGVKLDDLLPNLFGCSVEQAISLAKEHNLHLGPMTKTHAVGDGEWSLEVYGDDEEFLFEFVGSNGTRSESADLRGQLSLLLEFS